MLIAEQVRVHVRWMIRRDMPEVLSIERGSFEHCWTKDDFLRVMGQRDCIGMVAELGDKVVGFHLYQLCKDSVKMLNFAVHPDHRWRGVDSQMVAKLIGKLSSHRRTSITLEVREANLQAQLFFQRQGFRAVEVLRKYYKDSGEDAYRLQYRLEEQ